MRWTEQQIWDCAASMGLDPFPTEFHTVPAHVLYDVAARGIPGRFSHWGHGKEYFYGVTRHEYGLGRIYELVINSDPSQAYLLDSNSDVANLMVTAHVLGHTDFFRHNRAFAETPRDMPERAALRAGRIREYEERYGLDAVQETLDALLTLEFSVDPEGYQQGTEADGEGAGLPCSDLLDFLIKEAPLKDWQKDLASIVRDDGLYFWPQIRTKVVNEGWASFWHSRIMHAMDLTDGEFLEYARLNAGVVSARPGALNPYWLGLQILTDVERRHGRERLFEIRRLETDASLVRNYLTRELVEELGLVRYAAVGRELVVTEDDWEQVRDGIAGDLASRFPVIRVIDKDFEQSGALLLEHDWDGRPLKRQSALKVQGHLVALWRRPVLLRTQVDDKPVIWHHDGKSAGSRPE